MVETGHLPENPRLMGYVPRRLAEGLTGSYGSRDPAKSQRSSPLKTLQSCGSLYTWNAMPRVDPWLLLHLNLWSLSWKISPTQRGHPEITLSGLKRETSLWHVCQYLLPLVLFFPSNYPQFLKRGRRRQPALTVSQLCGKTCKLLQVLRNANTICILVFLKEKADIISHLFRFP